MREKRRTNWLAVAALLITGGFASGQVRAQQAGGPPPPLPPGPGAVFHRGNGAGMAGDVGMLFEGFEAGLGGQNVTDAPFTATYSTQLTQALPDGNQIQRTTTGTFARDSQGRTRRDMTLPNIGPWAASGKTAPHVVLISDPVAKMNYLLEPEQKTARAMGGRIQERLGHRGGPAGMPPPDALEAGGKDVVVTSLGTQTINGVLAEGTRYTRTIPAGAIGNEKPIVITRERWYSTELQTVVLTKRSDPLMGESISQLTDIQRSEPDTTLFQVPSDYKVRQGGPKMLLRGGRVEP